MNKRVTEAAVIHDEDAQQVRAFQQGSRQAFDALVLKYQQRIFGLCFRFFDDRDEADDAAQDTFVKVFRSLDTFRFESSFSTWLYRIAVNTCKNRRQSLAARLRRRMLRIVPQGDCDAPGTCGEPGDDSRSPGTLYDRKAAGRAVAAAIAQLPPGHREVVLLRDIEKLPYEEIAAVLGLELGTVKSRLARARAKLQERLKDLKNGL